MCIRDSSLAYRVVAVADALAICVVFFDEPIVVGLIGVAVCRTVVEIEDQ